MFVNADEWNRLLAPMFTDEEVAFRQKNLPAIGGDFPDSPPGPGDTVTARVAGEIELAIAPVDPFDPRPPEMRRLLDFLGDASDAEGFRIRRA